MAKKISQLTQATEVKSDDVTVIVQDGETKKLPLNMMVTKQDIENKKVAGLAKLDEIEATYENDTYTPTITVKNKSSVKTGEGDEVDYSANVMDGHAKSAILKGQTLVNLATNSPLKAQTGGKAEWIGGKLRISFANYIWSGGGLSFGYLIKPSTKYTVYINVVTNNCEFKINAGHYKGWSNESVSVINPQEKFSYKNVITTKSDVTADSQFYWFLASENPVNFTGDKYIDVEFVILEGDYTNVDIPYFNGMQSVKLPVLKTTGKNLFDGNMVKGTVMGSTGQVVDNSSDRLRSDYIPVNGNSFTVSCATNKWVGVFAYRKDKTYIGYKSSNGYATYKTNENIGFVVISTEELNDFVNNIQLEKGDTVTSYEPFKSNILTVNEDVVLRKVGDVQDTLDCLTGEVTERIGEIVFDGSENWVRRTTEDSKDGFEDTICFYYRTTNMTEEYGLGPQVLCDKFNYVGMGYNKTNESISSYKDVRYGNRDIFIRIKRERLETEDLDGFKKWLKTNILTVQYPIEKVVKTVDLMPSGTHPSTKPYCWKNGHIQLSSSGLLPNLEYSVVTSRAGQINQNAAMIVKNDKRIFDLEILLAGGLVNTTYQALTLQNQVETGLSKVSLSSEKEPDYLLYHMIMKLIEEKAYKLDDLTEKVSVFYLYEKLSDEQFETIYSELYPFVEEEYIELPEDGEIIEEPIVDEVLEEVENGVVM